MASNRPPSAARIIAAASIGNALEWYDIVVYSYFAVYISHVFFPSDDPTASLLATYGVFAVTYLIRPIGALILGTVTDRKGRKPTLTLTILLMTIGTGLLAVTPPYAYLGVASPVLVIIARLLQGFAAGGEFGSATSLMLEHLPSRKGFASSWQFASQGLSGLLAALIGAILTSVLTGDQLDAWGFRIPFVFGMIVGPVGLYIRRHVPETPEFKKLSESGLERTSVRPIFTQHLGRLLLVIGITSLGTAITYGVTYIPTYSIKSLGLPAKVGFLGVIGQGIAQTLFYPVSGRVADKVRRNTQMLTGAIATGVLVYPIFRFINIAPSLLTLMSAVIVLIVLKAWFNGAYSALAGDVFPPSVRGIGLSFAYNTGVAIFGGFTPLAFTALIAASNSTVGPSLWLFAIALLNIACLVVLRVLRWDRYGVEHSFVAE